MREELIDSIGVADCGVHSFRYAEANVDFPIVFPCIGIDLECCAGLDSLADKIMIDHNELPMFQCNDAGEYNDSGWYDFSIDVNGFNKHHVDTSIDVCVEFGWESGEYDHFFIDLDDDEQEYIYKELCEQIDVEGLLLECQEYLKRDGVETMILPLAS